MNEKNTIPQKVPETNSPAPVEKDKYIHSTYRDVSAPQEWKNKLIYERADLIYTGEKWNQTTDTAGVTGSSARTTFRSYDADDSNPTDFDKMWTYQMGRGQTYESSRNKHAVRDDATWKLCDAVLQQCEVPDWERHTAIRHVLQRDLQGFSRHYKGADGACVGFAIMELCDCPEEAEDCWVADQAVEVLRDFDRKKIEALISYVYDEDRDYNS